MPQRGLLTQAAVEVVVQMAGELLAAAQAVQAS